MPMTALGRVSGGIGISECRKGGRQLWLRSLGADSGCKTALDMRGSFTEDVRKGVRQLWRCGVVSLRMVERVSDSFGDAG